MFLTELSPLFEELVHKPVAFMGGFVSGILRLSLADEPVRNWLDQQVGVPSTTTPSTTTEANNGKNSGPQSITIE